MPSVQAFSKTAAAPDEFPWLPANEGALAVDVHEFADRLLIRAPIAGVRPGDVDLSLHHDMLTIRGMRREEETTDGSRTTLHQECHWGPFSRSIILPCPVLADEAQAELENGILTITLPKAARHGTIPIAGA